MIAPGIAVGTGRGCTAKPMEYCICRQTYGLKLCAARADVLCHVELMYIYMMAGRSCWKQCSLKQRISGLWACTVLFLCAGEK